MAPYSYDLLDNWGRQSPQELNAGLGALEVGQTVMTIFELVEFEPDRHITLVLRRATRVAGRGVVTYAVICDDSDPGATRLLVRLVWSFAGPAAARALGRRLLPLGDVVMMRRQLLNLKALAERDAARARRPRSGAAAEAS